MNTTDNLNLAENYYNAMLAKDFDKMVSYLHDNVHFLGPLAEMQGKEQIVTAAKNFGGILQGIQIRSRFASHDQIMFAYDMVAPKPETKQSIIIGLLTREEGATLPELMQALQWKPHSVRGHLSNLRKKRGMPIEAFTNKDGTRGYKLHR